MVLCIFATIIIYIILHEGGHSLVAMGCGAKITKFSIIGAYMCYEGGTFNSCTLALFNAAGMLLPLLLSIIFIIFYNKKSTNSFYRIFSFMVIVVPLGSLIAWFFVPVLYLVGSAPVNDDITKFINHSGIPPLLVTIVALLVFILLVFICWRKKILQNYYSTVRSIK